MTFPPEEEVEGSLEPGKTPYIHGETHAQDRRLRRVEVTTEITTV
jgi:hypothetical protein